MRGLMLLLIAVAVVAIAICGPPALAAGNTDYQIMQTAADSIAESPAASPALLPVVVGPGSCCALSATVDFQLKNIVPITRRAAEFQRWRCRLLLRSAADCC